MYRIVASDMDETFLATDHTIPSANIRAVRLLHDAGILFVPASGRAYGSIMSSLAPIARLLEGSYVISYNGGCINRVGEIRPLTSHTLPFETVRRIYEWGLSFDVGFHIYELTGRCWGNRITDAEHAYLKGHMEIDVFEGTDIGFLQDVPIAKMLYVRPDLAYLRTLVDRIPKDTYAGAWTTFSSGRYLEFNPIGVDKGSGLRDLAGQLGVDMADTIACGDAANDAQMIAAAGLGVAVANATDDVVALAGHQTQAGCDDGMLMEVARDILGLS